MNAITLQKCKRHASREAVARCPSCQGFFCRECVTEHDDKVICSDCLQRLSEKNSPRAFRLRWVSRSMGAVAGLFILWFTFYYLGQFLLSIPESFHEGTFWSSSEWKNDGK